MRLTISRKNILDNSILLILLLNVMILRWLGFQNIVNDIVTFLICLDLLLYRHSISRNVGIPFFILILYVILQFLMFRGGTYLFIRNVYRFFRGLLILIYVSQLIARKPEYVENFFSKLCKPINVYLLLNIPILILQSNGMISLAARDISKSITHIRADYYSGLFGLYGTPCLAIFCTFLFIYNIIYTKYYLSRMKRLRLAGLNILVLLFFLAFSVINDNKFFYIELVMYSLIVYIAMYEKPKNEKIDGVISNTRKRKNIPLRIVIILLSVSIAFMLSYNNFPRFHDLIDLLIRKVIEGFNYTDVRGGGERIGIILYMLHSKSILFGYGIPKIKLETGVGALGFIHIGSSDFGTMFAMGGIIYIVLFFITIFFCYRRNFYRSIIPALLTMAHLIMAVYTNAFYNTSTATTLALIYICCWVANNSKSRKNSLGKTQSSYYRTV